nr:hypothetical protein [Rugosimonospora africana]
MPVYVASTMLPRSTTSGCGVRSSGANRLMSVSTCQSMPSGSGSGVLVRNTSAPPIHTPASRSYWRPATEPDQSRTTFDHGPAQPAGGLSVARYGWP